MDERPKKKQRKNSMQNKTSAIHTNDIYPPTTYDSTLIFEQDYEYELSLIADMEKQDQLNREYIEQVAKIEAAISSAELENRNFHIKQVLRKIKLGSGTNLQDKIYISLLESWMDTNFLFINTEHADSFHSFLKKKIRVSNTTIEYMSQHIVEKTREK